MPHAFTTREGGVSTGIFASLNFGNPGELPLEDRDPPANIRANWDRVLSAIGVGDAQGRARAIVEVHQVHAAAVHVVRSGDRATPRDVKADAIVSDDPSRVLAVRVADCAPVLLASRDGRVVAAVHAGWRGVVGGVLPCAIARMRALGATDLVAAIGPCISVHHFEVGPEVVAEFERIFGRDDEIVPPGARASPANSGKAMVDLKAALRHQLLASALPASAIDTCPHCTVRDATEFFSHRRDRGLTGRMAAVIGPVP